MNTFPSIRKIVVPVDFGGESDRALALAKQMALDVGSAVNEIRGYAADITTPISS